MKLYCLYYLKQPHRFAFASSPDEADTKLLAGVTRKKIKDCMITECNMNDLQILAGQYVFAISFIGNG